MDPKTLSQLDPKLRETYERVMGTATPKTSASPAPSISSPTPTPTPTTPTSSPISPQSPFAQSPSMFSSSPSPANISAADAGIPQTSPSTQPVSPTPYHVVENQPVAFSDNTQPSVQPLPSPAAVAQMTKNNSGPMLRILYIIGSIIFFVIYTIFWIKVFKLPFFF